MALHLSWRIRTLGIRTLHATLLVLLLAGLAACGTSTIIAPETPPENATFLVVDSAGFAVAGATVFLVPVADVDGSRIDGNDVLTGAAEDRDEPLEDAVRLHGAGYQKGVTDAAGNASLGPVAEGRYFYFVRPAATDLEHLPGGSGCRLPLASTVFNLDTIEIVLSSQPSAAAAYLGSSRCTGCHRDQANHAMHAHKLGLAVPGQFAGQQDPARYPTFQEGWNRYLSAATHTGGTSVYLSDYDPSRGFDKFKTCLADPRPDGATLYAIAWLWRDTGDGKYKITLENVINPADPRSPWTLVVELTYGGALHMQRNLVAVPGRKGLYPILQFQDEGNDFRYDRTRHVYRDYHVDWFWDDTTKEFVDPPLDSNFDANCTACHATGFRRFQDAGTGEWLTDAVDDSNGAYDIDGDGQPDEVNVGCEACHGPGSEHVAWVQSAASAGHKKRYIVTPANLSPSREIMICGRCHDRVEGYGSVRNTEPLNVSNDMLPVGSSRQAYLSNGYLRRKGPEASDLWNDDLHSLSHQQQYSDFIKSTKYRNDRVLVTCSDCHDNHGNGAYQHQLSLDPNDTSSAGLCAQCHLYDVIPHMLAHTGNTHRGTATGCYLCHMADTAKAGSGLPSLLLAPPTGQPSDEDKVYYQNDRASHLFLRIPKRTHQDVAGEKPSDAMPIPFTKSCGQPCHDPSTLPLMVKFAKLQDPFAGEDAAPAPAEGR